MSDRLREVSAAAFARIVEREVERAFEANRALPDDVCELPAIGGPYDPHAPREEHAVWKQMVINALCARQWFEDEVPRSWGLSLPLTEAECVQMLNPGLDVTETRRRRLRLVAEYARRLRQTHWEYWRHDPFEVYCAYALVPT